MQVDGGDKIYAIANEDMDRTRDEKAAAVHFTRFELSAENVADLKSGKPLTMGIDHQSIPCTVKIEGVTRDTLLADLT